MQAWLARLAGIGFLVVLLGFAVLAAHLHWAEDSTLLCFEATNISSYNLPGPYTPGDLHGGGYSGCRAGTSSRFLPDQGAWWYYWRLPVPTVGSRLFVWACYILHQFAAWAAQLRDWGWQPAGIAKRLAIGADICNAARAFSR